MVLYSLDETVVIGKASRQTERSEALWAIVDLYWAIAAQNIASRLTAAQALSHASRLAWSGLNARQKARAS